LFLGSPTKFVRVWFDFKLWRPNPHPVSFIFTCLSFFESLLDFTAPVVLSRTLPSYLIPPQGTRALTVSRPIIFTVMFEPLEFLSTPPYFLSVDAPYIPVVRRVSPPLSNIFPASHFSGFFPPQLPATSTIRMPYTVRTPILMTHM